MTHSNSSSKGKKVLSLALCAALTLSAAAAIGVASSSGVSVSAADYGLAETIQEGTILHCFDWTLSDIKAELPNIAKAGFTSIQTSPVQPAAGQGPWYWLYQPTAFTVGTELGTKDELKELCEEADKYGIKIVVDVVANHLAGDHKVIQEDLRDDKYWHTLGEIKQYSNRKQVTDGNLEGLIDIKSEDEYVQTVVLNYINELKELGVDGIRWDAAKHIALPSEGCEFWKTVTDTGLYNYGEILGSPYDGGGDELMVEYSEYMSVTDNTYGNLMRDAFKSGRAPGFDGNWSEDIDPSKLVYWGESHDTYSNGEGKESNGVTQNVIDRTYAVAAARQGATSLYLSRPEAKAKDSIRYGVKGDRQFSSDEIAAVNHFHNEMGPRADAYGVTDNCSVVTRQGGGAVLVLGKGENKSVTVENVNSYVPEGTYIDDVSGNIFTVTAAEIKGMIGDTGIAVIKETVEPRVSASVVSGTKFDDHVQLYLKALNVSDATYETSEGKTGSFENGDALSVGEDTEKGGSVTVTLKGKNQSGEEITETYTYYKNESKEYPALNGGGVVFDNTETNWDTVNVYVYDEITTSTTVTNGSWPGVKMEDCGDNLFKYELPSQFEPCKHIMVIFNNGKGDQIPGQMQAGLTLTYTQRKLYNGTKWLDLPGQTAETSDTEASQQASETSAETSDVSAETSDDTSDETSVDVSQVSTVDPSTDTSNTVSDTTSTVSTVSTASTVSTVSTVSTASTTSTASTASTTTTGTTTSTVTTTTTTVGAVSTSDNSMFMIYALAILGLVSGLIGMAAYQKKKDN